MEELVKMLLIVCPLVFLGGFVDSVAGGGGLITLPAYMMAGVPVHFAAGTNKVVNGCGSATASVKFFRSGKIRVHAALCAALGGADWGIHRRGDRQAAQREPAEGAYAGGPAGGGSVSGGKEGFRAGDWRKGVSARL